MPEETAGPAGLGLSFFRLKRYAEAQSALEAAARLSPESSEVQQLLGNAYLHGGEREKALASYQKALEITPVPLMFNNIAYQLTEKNESIPLALEYAKESRESGGAGLACVEAFGVTSRRP